MIMVLVLGLVVTQAASTLAVASPYSFKDPSGDAAKGVNADIVKVTITHSSTVKLVVGMKHAAPFSSWGTTGNLVNIQIHINPPSSLYICASKAVAALCDGESIVPGCHVSRSRSAANNSYAFSVARSCLGNPAKIKLFVLGGAFGATQVSDSDLAPNSGSSKSVAFG
jgi:hypothetical protein